MTTTNQTWQPNDNDHLIYDWVKMQGKTQAEVSSLLRIHQGTVSRVIQRYDRWLAHMKARENGRLDPKERLRAQRQLTFDRNELILASCLRIAKETEGFIDASRSTVSRPLHAPSQENELRTTSFTIDRTGTVCRFLRLAHRINMEQDKLAVVLARMDDPVPEPLTDEQLADQARQAALDDAEIASGTLRFRQQDPVGWAPPTEESDSVGCMSEAKCTTDDDLVTSVPPGDAPTRGSSLAEPLSTPDHSEDAAPTLNVEPETLNPAPDRAHNAHHAEEVQIAATAGKPCTCVIQLDAEKISHQRINTPDPPPRRYDERPQSAPREASPIP